MEVRPLVDVDVDAFVALRRAALATEPMSFASGPGDDAMGDAEALSAYLARWPEAVIFGAFDPGLVGVAGLYREQHVKTRHRARFWGLWVESQHRRRGAGSALLEALLDHARQLPGIERVTLGVSSAAPEARRLYERAGFRVWGTEPDAVRHDGGTAATHHLSLEL